MGFLKAVINTGLTLFILAYFLPTVSYMDWSTLIIAAIVFTLVHKIIKPILKLLFLPINIITLGFFSLVLNVILLWLVTYLVPGFRIAPMVILGVEFNQFFSLLIISALIGFIQSFLGIFIK